MSQQSATVLTPKAQPCSADGGGARDDVWDRVVKENSVVDVEAMLTTLHKYLENARKNVTEPKYRTIKSSNKFFLAVLAVKWSAAFIIERLGWDCFWSESAGEVVFSIPRDLILEDSVKLVQGFAAKIKGDGESAGKGGNLRGTT